MTENNFLQIISRLSVPIVTKNNAEAKGFGGHSKSAVMMRMIVHAVLKIAAACIEIERPHDVIPIGFINRAIIKIIGKFNAV